MTRHAKFTSKGQITIPVDVRRALGFKDGDIIEVELVADGVKLKPLRSIRHMAGIARRLAPYDVPDRPWAEVRQIAEDYAAREFVATKMVNE